MQKKFFALIALMLLITASALADTVVQVGSEVALGPNDSINFAQLGGDGAIIPTNTPLTTTGGKPAFIDFFGGTHGQVAVECPAAPSCSWTGGFTAGDSLVWSFDSGTGGGTAPVGFRLGGVEGVGALVQSDAPGQFTAQLQWFDTALVLGGTFTATSDLAGDPLFIGALDTSNNNGIGAVKFNLTDNTNDLAIDTLQLRYNTAAVPEPSFTFLLGGALVGLGWRLRRQSIRSS